MVRSATTSRARSATTTRSTWLSRTPTTAALSATSVPSRPRRSRTTRRPLTASVTWTPAAVGVFNLFRDLFRAPDVPYILVKRIGTPQADAFAAGQIISMYAVNTDIPVDIVEDGSPVMFDARFTTTGDVNVNYTVAA